MNIPKLTNSYLNLPETFYHESQAEFFSNPQVLAFNHDLAEQLGLDSRQMSQDQLAKLFSGQGEFLGTKPVALAYAGHQFGHFVEQLGDGRALLLGQLNSKQLGLVDIQLKGSGRTKFSRGGDGKSSLGPVVREYLLSEAMFAMGIPTTRALAAVVTGDQVQRKLWEPGAVLTRVASSHLRVGSFEYFAAKQDQEGLSQLVDYAMERHYPEVKNLSDPWVGFFMAVAKRQSKLIAKWLSVGFIHGVMNTDNFTISGETLDFGPCAFMDNYNANQVFSSIDRRGRYSYSNQIPIALWNLSRLASCLLLLYPEDKRTEAASHFQELLAELDVCFQKDRDAAFAAKLGLSSDDPEAQEKVADVLYVLDKDGLDFTLSFSQLSAVLTEKEVPLADRMTKRLLKVLNDLKAYHSKLGNTPEDLSAKLCLANPGLIPRNHLVQKAIKDANRGNYDFFHRLYEAFKSPCDIKKENHDLMLPPSEEERVLETFCGT